MKWHPKHLVILTLFCLSLSSGLTAVSVVAAEVVGGFRPVVFEEAPRASLDKLGPTLYDTIIVANAERTGVPAELGKAVVAVESGFQWNIVSPKGAKGLGQLLDSTSARFGVRNPFDPEENIRGMFDYLAFLLGRYGGNVELALAAYNAGEDRVVDRIPSVPETQNYVPSVLSLYRGERTIPLRVATSPREAQAVNGPAIYIEPIQVGERPKAEVPEN